MKIVVTIIGIILALYLGLHIFISLTCEEPNLFGFQIALEPDAPHGIMLMHLRHPSWKWKL